ncbi:MAG: CCA tRNA nucleotidyltransferase [Candidatus Omnitrophica bacterium]|nr:CCA tRNA nucleotidyltransferase [Candidatus Omnitrophota bacterium]
MKKRYISSVDILEKLREFSKKKRIVTYLVGGYIRDRLLRRKSNDIDIVMEVDALTFAKDFALEYNLPMPVFYGRFGTAMIEVSGVKIEFATARKESYPDDSRKPYIRKATIEEDCARRDFTINAIAQNLITGEIIDFFNGRQDIKKKIIRTPVSPERTFYDDPLRILRGIRFATRLKFEIEKHTLEGMKKNVARLSIVSIERISEEILKMLEAKEPSRGFYLMDDVGALDIILPEVSALKEKRTEHPCKELFPHTLKVLDNISVHTKDVYLKIAALLHDIGKPSTLQVINGKVSFHRHEFIGQKMVYKICRRLNIPEDKGKFIGRMIRFHLRPHLLAKENPTDNALRRFIREMGKDIRPLFTLAKADLTSHNPGRVKNALERLTILEERIKEINRKDKISSFKLAVDGYVIMELFNIPQSRKVGEIKQKIESLVLDGVIRNRKRDIIRYIKENKKALLLSNTEGEQ